MAKYQETKRSAQYDINRLKRHNPNSDLVIPLIKLLEKSSFIYERSKERDHKGKMIALERCHNIHSIISQLVAFHFRAQYSPESEPLL